MYVLCGAKLVNISRQTTDSGKNFFMAGLDDFDAGDGVVEAVAFHLDLGGDAFLEQFDVADDVHAAAAHLVEAVQGLHDGSQAVFAQRAEVR